MNQIVCRVHARQRGTERFGLETVAKNDFGIYACPPSQRLRSSGDTAHAITVISKACSNLPPTYPVPPVNRIRFLRSIDEL